jgi:hypothetical protein
MLLKKEAQSGDYGEESSKIREEVSLIEEIARNIG